MLGDFLANLRSSLDHIAGAIVPLLVRSHVNFPIYWQGVWDPPVDGEEKQRGVDRRNWTSNTEKMAPEAVAIIKDLQPPDAAVGPGNLHALQVLNRLRNRDTHSKLTLVASTLIKPEGGYRAPDGTWHSVIDDPNVSPRDDEDLGVPDGATDVQIKGTTEVAIGYRSDPEISFNPDVLRALWGNVAQIREQLQPFDKLPPE